MVNERLNVLSIDWDYFISASMDDRVKLFPDGSDDFGSSIQNMIWATKYASSDALKDVKSDTTSLNKVIKYLQIVSSCVKEVMVVDSHKYAYDFILDYYKDSSYSGVNLVNVDFHHDVYTNGDKVDCGNWLSKLFKSLEYTDSSYTWVSRKDSDISSIDESIKELSITNSLDIVQEYEWDLVFVCRSAMWSPPHLDKFFKKYFEWLTRLEGVYTKYEKGIFKSRYNAELKSDIKQVGSEFQKFRMYQEMSDTFKGSKKAFKDFYSK